MQNKNLRSALAATAAVFVLSLPAVSVAGLVEAGASPQEAPAEPYLAQAVRHAAAPAAAAREDDSIDWIELPVDSTGRTVAIKLRGQSDLALWNIVLAAHAQQKGKVFDLVEAGSKTVWDIEKEQVSAVPLPGAVWLFVMGILGLAGTRIPPQGIELGGALSAALRRVRRAVRPSAPGWMVPARLRPEVG